MDNIISNGSILFSFNESNNNIEIFNAYPTSDEVGKNSFKEKEYFDFAVSVAFIETNKVYNQIEYEISLIPEVSNTLAEKYIRVNLKLNGEDVLINNQNINNFSDLPSSKYLKNGKMLLTKKVNKSLLDKFTLRLWLSKDYSINNEQKVFKCYVYVNAK